MPLQSTSGAASYDAFGGGVAAVPKYIEDYFSTFLYQGTGAAQTITNGIDLSTKGGLVWIKGRSQAWDHGLFDTARGAGYRIISNSTAAENFSLNYVSSFNNNGFSLGSPSSSTNTSGDNYVSWSWAKAPKFFDVVTYTGNGSARTIAHNLGSVPACIIVKCTSVGYNWMVYHSSLGNTQYLNLNNTNPVDTDANLWNSTTPTSSVFSVGASLPTNQNGQTYVAYLFAHNAGGFGLTGTDNVISCGSFTADNAGGGAYAGGATVNLGYEPQFVMFKETNSTLSDPNWIMVDTFRGYRAQETSGSDVGQQRLRANTSEAEANAGGCSFPTSTGFSALQLTGGATYIYIAIRRGPMKVPTSGTSVFQPIIDTGDTIETSTATFPLDMQFNTLYNVSNATYNNQINDRLRGIGFAPSFTTTPHLTTASTSAETTSSSYLAFKGNGMDVTKDTGWGATSAVFYNFRRAPSFFDEVCVTPSYPTPVTHNLGAVPKLRFEKPRTLTAEWKAIYFDGTTDEYELALNSTRAASLQSGRPALPTSTSFVSFWDGAPIVAYLFAPVTGVQYISKFTGNGSSQTINCGFTGGARFICIKAFSTTGDWKVIDTARGIVSGNDPTLAFNTTSAEVTGTDCIDPDSSGFIVNQESTNNLNVNGVEYLVWAIA